MASNNTSSATLSIFEVLKSSWLVIKIRYLVIIVIRLKIYIFFSNILFMIPKDAKDIICALIWPIFLEAAVSKITIDTLEGTRSSYLRNCSIILSNMRFYIPHIKRNFYTNLLIPVLKIFVILFIRLSMVDVIIVVIIMNFYSTSKNSFFVFLSAILIIFSVRIYIGCLFSTPIIITEKFKIVDSIRRSWDMTSSHKSEIDVIFIFFRYFPLFATNFIYLRIINYDIPDVILTLLYAILVVLSSVISSACYHLIRKT